MRLEPGAAQLLLRLAPRDGKKRSDVESLTPETPLDEAIGALLFMSGHFLHNLRAHTFSDGVGPDARRDAHAVVRLGLVNRVPACEATARAAAPATGSF